MDSLNLNAYTRDMACEHKNSLKEIARCRRLEKTKPKKKPAKDGLRCLWGKKVFNKYILYILAHNCTGKPH